MMKLFERHVNYKSSTAHQGLIIGLLVSTILAVGYGAIVSMAWLPALLVVFITGFPYMASAVLIGTMTGWLIGGIFEKAGAVLSRSWAAIIGLAVCSCLAFLINFPPIIFGRATELLIVGIPSGIYVVTGILISLILWNALKQPADPRTINIIAPGFILAVFATNWFIYNFFNRTIPQVVLVQEGVNGMVALAFDDALGEPPIYEGLSQIYTVPDRGVLFTQPGDSQSDYPQQFYTVDASGNRKVLPYFYRCVGEEIPHDKVIICGHQHGIFNVDGRSIPYTVYFIGQKGINQTRLQEFDRRDISQGDNLDELFPER